MHRRGRYLHVIGVKKTTGGRSHYCRHPHLRHSHSSLLLSGVSDPRARPAEEDSGAIVTRDDYRTGEKAAGISSLFSCRIGRTPVCGGHGPPAWREASRTRARSLRSLYTQVWTNLFSPPISLVQQAARGENFSRASMALAHPSSTFGMSPGPKV